MDKLMDSFLYVDDTFWKEIENKSDPNHKKYKPLLNKMEEENNNLKNNDLVFYIRKTYFDKVYLAIEDDRKFMRNVFIGIFSGVLAGLAFRYLMSSSFMPTSAQCLFFSAFFKVFFK